MNRLLSIGLIVGLLTASSLGQENTPPIDKQSNLKYARQCANWLDSVAVTKNNQTFWPVAPDESKADSTALYSGTPGVVLFYLELFHATLEGAYLETAVRGGDWLIAHGLDFDDDTDASFYTGVAGIGWVFDQLYKATRIKRFAEAGQRCFEFVCRTARRSNHNKRPSADWNGVNDIIGGAAGIGFYLIRCSASKDRGEALEFAMATGDGLIMRAKPVPVIGATGKKTTGCRWMMSANFPREMPNYSHGTAGICDFLLALDNTCRGQPERVADYDGRFLKAATQGAIYLQSLMLDPVNKGLIPHNFPDGTQLFYLGWCHGPTGTAGFFQRLHRETGDRRWQSAANRLTASVLDSGIPGVRTEGFWENAGLCCGNAGVASFLLDRYESTRDERALEVFEALTDDILKRATDLELSNGKKGLKWVQAEHRIRPDLVHAQTGLMQGAAGIGMLFIKRHQLEGGNQLSINWPLLPF